MQKDLNLASHIESGFLTPEKEGIFGRRPEPRASYLLKANTLLASP
jgi:hypothetical protein